MIGRKLIASYGTMTTEVGSEPGLPQLPLQSESNGEGSSRTSSARSTSSVSKTPSLPPVLPETQTPGLAVPLERLTSSDSQAVQNIMTGLGMQEVDTSSIPRARLLPKRHIQNRSHTEVGLSHDEFYLLQLSELLHTLPNFRL